MKAICSIEEFARYSRSASAGLPSGRSNVPSRRLVPFHDSTGVETQLASQDWVSIGEVQRCRFQPVSLKIGILTVRVLGAVPFTVRS